MQDDLTNEEMAQMLVKANGTIEMIKGYIPTIDYLIEALTTNNLLTTIVEVLKAIAITALSFVMYMLISQKNIF